MPTRREDPVIGFYSLLPIILARYGGHREIWNNLQAPLRKLSDILFDVKKKKVTVPMTIQKIPRKNSDGFTMAKVIDETSMIRDAMEEDETSPRPGKVIGIKAEIFSLYGALRAFIHTNQVHYIGRECVEDVYDVFLHKPMLQNKYTMIFQLIAFLANDATNGKSVDIEIPTNFEYIHRKASEETLSLINSHHDHTLAKFSDPIHCLLYHLCIIPEIPDEMAMYVFVSIRTKSKRHSTSIHFPYRSSNKIKTFSGFQEEYEQEIIRCTEKEKMTPDLPRNLLAGPMEAILQSVEDLSYHPMNHPGKDVIDPESKFRGNIKEPSVTVPMTAEQILQDPSRTYKIIPIDMIREKNRTRYLHLFDSLPIFGSEVLQDDRDFSSNDLRQMMYGPYLPPFFGCKDFLECILVYPVLHVQCISTETCNTPLMAQEQTNSLGMMYDFCRGDQRIHSYLSSSSSNDNDDEKKRGRNMLTSSSDDSQESFQTLSPRVDQACKKWRQEIIDMIENGTNPWKDGHETEPHSPWLYHIFDRSDYHQEPSVNIDTNCNN